MAQSRARYGWLKAKKRPRQLHFWSCRGRCFVSVLLRGGRPSRRAARGPTPRFTLSTGRGCHPGAGGTQTASKAVTAPGCPFSSDAALCWLARKFGNTRKAWRKPLPRPPRNGRQTEHNYQCEQRRSRTSIIPLQDPGVLPPHSELQGYLPNPAIVLLCCFGTPCASPFLWSGLAASGIYSSPNYHKKNRLLQRMRTDKSRRCASVETHLRLLFRYPNPQFFLKKFKPQSLDFVVCLVEISGIEPLTS